MVAPINVKIVGDSTGLHSTLGTASKDIDIFGGKLSKDIPGWAGFAVHATEKVAKAVFHSGQAAKDAAAEEAIFADAMSTLGVTTDELNGPINDAILGAQKLAFEDTEARKALTSLQTATGDTDETMRLFAIAQDLARKEGVDLGTASDAVAKAAAGEDAALRRMLPGLKDTGDAHATIEEAAKNSAGAAEQYGKSSQAAGKKANIAFSELKETLGAELGPALSDLWDSLQPILADLIELAKKVLPPVIKGITLVAKAIGKALDAVGKFIDAIQRLMGKLRELLEPIQKVIDKLANIDLNPFNRAQGIINGQTTQAAGINQTAATSGASPRGGGGVQINIYGDPSVIEARVTSALRAYARRNGVGAVFQPERN